MKDMEGRIMAIREMLIGRILSSCKTPLWRFLMGAFSFHTCRSTPGLLLPTKLVIVIQLLLRPDKMSFDKQKNNKVYLSGTEVPMSVAMATST